jgi:hypothetical protein
LDCHSLRGDNSLLGCNAAYPRRERARLDDADIGGSGWVRQLLDLAGQMFHPARRRATFRLPVSAPAATERTSTPTAERFHAADDPAGWGRTTNAA